MARPRLRDSRIRPKRHRLRLTATVSAGLERTARTAAGLFLIPPPPGNVPMRTACGYCGHRDGRVTTKGAQAVVRCSACGRYAYNAPRKDQIRWWGRIS